jgi:ABC-type transport system substrate-binding protein
MSLIGCGGGDGDNEAKDASGLLSKPQDTTTQAKKGGEWHGRQGADVQSFDAQTGQSSDTPHALRTYSRLIGYKSMKYPEDVTTILEPDSALSWETSPDGLTYTYKIRPNFKFDPRPPTNGRAMTAEDAKFSIDRFLKSSRNRGDLANAVNPNSPIVSASAPDNSTVQIKLAFPYAPFNLLMAYSRYITLFPTEADGGFDVRQTMRGTGAWRLTEDTRGVRTVYERNPDWHNASKVFYDKMIWFVIPESATNLAQFRSGALDTTVIGQNEILRLKSEKPDLQMQALEEYSQGSQWMRFGYMPRSIFLDERVRQAVSLLLDRQLYIDTFGEVEQFRAVGLEVPSRWNSSYIAGYDEWLDPQDEKEFGANAKWFKHDPAEAKKLLRAAGHNLPIKTIYSYPISHYAPPFDKKVEVLKGMLEGNGDFQLEVQTSTYAGVFAEKVVNGDGQWEGIGTANTSSRPEIDTFLHEWFHSASQRSDHTLADGKPDTFLDNLVTKQRAEADANKRAAILKEIQQYAAGKMYKIWEPGQALGYRLAQPWVGNWGVYRGPQGGSVDQEGNIYHWDKRLA